MNFTKNRPLITVAKCHWFFLFPSITFRAVSDYHSNSIVPIAFSAENKHSLPLTKYDVHIEDREERCCSKTFFLAGEDDEFSKMKANHVKHRRPRITWWCRFSRNTSLNMHEKLGAHKWIEWNVFGNEEESWRAWTPTVRDHLSTLLQFNNDEQKWLYMLTYACNQDIVPRLF